MVRAYEVVIAGEEWRCRGAWRRAILAERVAIVREEGLS